MNLFRSLERSARLWPEAPAVALGLRTRASYLNLAQSAASLSSGLVERLGLHRGDRVALVTANCPEYLEALYACWHAGLVVVPVNAKLHAKELDYIFDNSATRAALVSSDW